RCLSSLFVVVICFFFFQAEDGIRDRTVTGVQTCALPISLPPRGSSRSRNTRLDVLRVPDFETSSPGGGGFGAGALTRDPAAEARSEERRVGKEWRCRWGPAHEKEKTI